MVSHVMAFAGVALVLVLVPGPALAVVLGNSARFGMRAGIATISGLATAITLHAAASVLGLSIVLARSAVAFQIVKYVGAGYLLFLGAKALWQSRRQVIPRQFTVPQTEIPARVLFRQGLLTNLLNPKPALFYLAVLPRFIEPGDSVLAASTVLVAVHLVLLITWYTVCACGADRLRGLLSRPGMRRGIDRVLGGMLIALGIRVAAS